MVLFDFFGFLEGFNTAMFLILVFIFINFLLFILTPRLPKKIIYFPDNHQLFSFTCIGLDIASQIAAQNASCEK